MWTDSLNRYLDAIGPGSNESLMALELIDPRSHAEQLPRIASPYVDFFGPYEVSQALYPLTRLGSYARLDRHYLPRWVNLESLLARLLSAINFSTLSTPPTTDDLVAAIGLIGSLTYSAEWVSDPETTADLDNCASSPSVLDANSLLATNLIHHLKSSAARPLHILDIGVGRGNTIVSVLEELARVQCPRVDVSLLDISADSLAKTAARLERIAASTSHHLGSEMSAQIRELIYCNLVELGRSVAPQPNNYDVIISGGTLFHSTDKERIFSWALSSLRPNGIFIFWDWFAPCWASPQLAAGAQLHHLPGDLFEIPQDEIEAVEQTWFHGWLGPRGYFNYGTHEKYDNLRADFLHRMANLRVGKPFSFVSWLQTVATSYPKPAQTGHYLCIEGYTSVSVYLTASATAGFQATEILALDQLKQRYGQPPGHVGRADSYRNTIKMLILEPDSRRCMENQL